MSAGDVLLVRGLSAKSKAIWLSQKIFYSNATSSHVALSLGDGVFVHATGDGGVHLVFFPDELKYCEDKWRVIRLRDLNKTQTDEIQMCGIHYIRQTYNIGFFGNGTDHSSFCSELVAKIYNRACIEIIDSKQTSNVLPCHFDKEADSLDKWSDVTDEYLNLLEKLSEDDSLHRLAFNTIVQSLKRRSLHSAFRESLIDNIENRAIELGCQETANTVDTIIGKLQDNRILTFWDEHDTKSKGKKGSNNE